MKRLLAIALLLGVASIAGAGDEPEVPARFRGVGSESLRLTAVLGEPTYREQGTVFCLAFAGDEHLLVGTEHDGFWLWDRRTRERVACLGSDVVTVALATSPDGKRALAADQEQLLLVDLATRTTTRLLEHAGESVIAVGFAGNAKALALADDGALRSWDLATGAVAVASCALSDLELAALAPDGSLLLVTDGERTAIQPVPPGAPSFIETPEIMDACFSADAKLLLLARTEGLELWDAKARTRLWSEPCGDASCVGFSSDGKTCFDLADETLTVRDVATGRTLARRLVIADVAAFAPDGRTIVVGGDQLLADEAGTTLDELDARTAEPTRARRGHAGPVAALSAAGGRLASASREGSWIAWAGLRPIARGSAGFPLEATALSPDGHHVLTGACGNNRLAIEDAPGPTLVLRALEGAGGARALIVAGSPVGAGVHGVAFLAAGERAVAATDEGVLVLDLRAGTGAAVTSAAATACAVTREGGIVVGTEEALLLLDGSGRVLREVELAGARAIACSGALAAVACGDGSLTVHDLSSGERRAVELDDPAHAVAFLPSGQLVASVGSTLRVLDAAGAERGRVEVPEAVLSLAADRDTLWAGTEGGLVLRFAVR